MVRIVLIAEPSLWCKFVGVSEICRRLVRSILVNRDTRVLWNPSAENHLSTWRDDARDADWYRGVHSERLLQTSV